MNKDISASRRARRAGDLAGREVGLSVPAACACKTNQPVTVAVRRADEPPAVSYKTLPSALPADQEKALARRLFEPFAEHVLKDGKEEDKRKLADEPGRDRPGLDLEHLDAVKFADPEELNGVRSNIAGALVSDNPEEAAAVAEGISDPSQRAFVYAGVTRDLLKRDPVRARRFLEQAILNNQATKQPRSRVTILDRIINLLIDLGEIERARESIRVQRELVASVFTTGRMRRLWLRHTSWFRWPGSILPRGSPSSRNRSKRRKRTRMTHSVVCFDRHFGQIAY